jgi:hypothetical protein
MPRNATSSIFPFPNATGISAQGFRSYAGQGVVSLPNVTTFNGGLTFYEAINITELYLQNVTHITSPNNTFRSMNSLEILDIRNMVDFGGLLSDYFRFGTPANWTVHANTAMQTAGTGGTMHPSFQDIINRGATIIWY